MTIQQSLPFELATSNRRNDLRLALACLRPGLAVIRLCERIFAEARIGEQLAGGLGQWRVDYKTLEAEANLGCSRSTVVRTVRKAKRLGLVRVQEQKGLVTTNAYSIGWSRVESIVYPNRAQGQNEPTQGQFDPTQGQNEPTQGQFDPTENRGENDGVSPRGRSGAPIGLIDLSTTTTVGDRAVQIGMFTLLEELWPAGRGPVKDVRDQRLLYCVSVLRLHPDHESWIDRAVRETVQARPRSVLGKLNRSIDAHIPIGLTRQELLRSIDVPRWALADPREWFGRDPSPRVPASPCPRVPDPAERAVFRAALREHLDRHRPHPEKAPNGEEPQRE
jgi:hypothetical protein